MIHSAPSPRGFFPFPKLYVAAVLIAVLCRRGAAGTDEIELVSVRVVGPTGPPVESAQACARKGPIVTKPWADARDGIIHVKVKAEVYENSREQLGGEYDLMVRADGYAPGIIQATLPSKEEVKVTLQTGRRVELKFIPPAGRAIPDTLEPAIYYNEQRRQAWSSADMTPTRIRLGPLFSICLVERLAPDRFMFQLPQVSPPFYVMISQSDFLIGFEAGPFSKEQIIEDKLEISLPEPGGGYAAFQKSELSAAYKDFQFNLYKDVQDGVFSTLNFDSNPNVRLSFENFAPGDYTLKAQAYGPKGDWCPEQRTITIKSSEQTVENFDLAVFDPLSVKGSCNAKVSLVKPDGSPASNVSCELIYADDHFGFHKIDEAESSADGEVIFESLAGGSKNAPNFWCNVRGQGNAIGFITFPGAITNRRFRFTVPPGPGEMAPDIRLIDIESNQSVRLSNFRGQVVFLDFWAIWCAFCQEPMRELNNIMARREDDWRNKATIISVSVDKAVEEARKHLKQKVWDKTRNLWASDGPPDLERDAAKAFVIKGLPESILIDASGKIVWRGSPRAIDAEKEIDRVLKSR